jgi:4-hydroxybenzoate polyprenyltransferase
MANLRTFLVLGRASNWPTVWSNCLAGWLLGGGGEGALFTLVGLGATCLYVGGMFLNDAFDAGFDRQYRKDRPIPSGAISERGVWGWGLFWLGSGCALLIVLGKATAMFTLLLVGAIVFYDAVHKLITFAPLLMAVCRFLLYLVAASAADDGVTGLALWSALALAAYIVGLSYIARKESLGGPLPFWPAYLLAWPVVLALIVNSDAGVQRAFLLSALLAAWVLRCVRTTFWAAPPDIGRTVSGLLAGIVLVDLLAVAPERYPFGLVFLLLFGAALLFQRFIPAT